MSVILFVSILIRLLAFGQSVVLWRRISDWRMGFLTVMLALMTSRQTLTMLKTSETWLPSLRQEQLTELPGLVVSVMAFLAVLFLGNLLIEQREAEMEKRQLIASLERKNLELERFLYTASHDLKSPLVTISGFLGVLEQDAAGGKPERLKHDMEYIRGAVHQMERSLSELLEISRVGVATVATEEVSLAELVDECLASMRDKLRGRGIKVLKVSDLPVVMGDRSKLLELLRNLLENAVKFSDEQSDPRIEIGTRRDSESVVCYVADNGTGIDERYHERVFGLFERLDNRVEGTGLGLAIVKRIAEIHGGRAWVESEGEGRGSTFCFALPQDRVAGASIQGQ